MTSTKSAKSSESKYFTASFVSRFSYRDEIEAMLQCSPRAVRRSGARGWVAHFPRRPPVRVNKLEDTRCLINWSLMKRKTSVSCPQRLGSWQGHEAVRSNDCQGA